LRKVGTVPLIEEKVACPLFSLARPFFCPYLLDLFLEPILRCTEFRPDNDSPAYDAQAESEKSADKGNKGKEAHENEAEYHASERGDLAVLTERLDEAFSEEVEQDHSTKELYDETYDDERDKERDAD
jgi:hypothetical protein